MARITQKLVESLKPSDIARFVRDDTLIGFGVKITPSGRVSFIVEGRIKGGRTRRTTLGQFPAISVSRAREEASDVIRTMKQGNDPKLVREAEIAKNHALGKTVGAAFEEYLLVRDLRPETQKNYRIVFNAVFHEWESKPLRSITRADAEKRFIQTREERGQSMSDYAFRIARAVFNFAKADEVAGERLLADNPIDVIKQKRYNRRLKPRDRFLSDDEIGKVIQFYQTEKDWPETLPHGVTDQGINYVMLLLCSGLRKSEGMRLRWDDIDWHKKNFVVRDTKNTTDHFVPLSGMLAEVLGRQKEALKKRGKEASPWVFPSKFNESHMTEPKSQLKRICDYTGIEFRFHDLRRTFATHAQANGVAYELIQKALNHKSQSVTEGYIITQIDTLRPVFDAVADGYLRYYDPDVENEREVEHAIEQMTEQEVAELAEGYEPAKFPDRGETEIR